MLSGINMTPFIYVAAYTPTSSLVGDKCNLDLVLWSLDQLAEYAAHYVVHGALAKYHFLIA